jgi:hypothetical protein
MIVLSSTLASKAIGKSTAERVSAAVLPYAQLTNRQLVEQQHSILYTLSKVYLQPIAARQVKQLHQSNLHDSTSTAHCQHVEVHDNNILSGT